MKKFISGMFLLSLIFVLSGTIMFRNQVSELHREPEETTVCVQPSHDVREPVENIEETVEESLVHSDPALDKTYTDEELEILALIVYQEAGEDRVSDDTRRLVAQVFLNRVNDSRFPDSFYEVATAERQYGRLYWTGIVWPDRASSQVEAHAVERAYKIAQEVLESDDPICPEDVIFQAEFVQGDIYAEQDGMYFCFG